MSHDPHDRPLDDPTQHPSGDDALHDNAEPTPGSDGDGPEAGYTPPAELAEDDKSPKPAVGTT